MGQYWLNVAILRIIIPATFVICVIWRPTGMSLIYLLLMMISPFVPIPTHETMKKSTGLYLKICITLCCLTALCQSAFQATIFASPEMYKIFSENCAFLEELFRHIGLVRMDDADVFDVFFWLLPEVISLPVIITMYYLCRRSTPREIPNDPENLTMQNRRRFPIKYLDEANEKIINFLGRIGTYVVLATLCFAACLNPSIEAAFYFLIFLGSATWWACDRELEKGFAIICRIVMIFATIHLIAFGAYQNQWPQEYIPKNSTWARYLALEAYYSTNCSSPREIILAQGETEWMGYTYVLWLFWLYYILALQSRFLFRKPLMRFGSGRSGLLQDSTGSVIVQDGNHDEGIQLQSVSEGVSEPNPGAVEHVIMAVYAILQLIVNSSHLATNIMMMAWSIMYHSWTTFVFLLWALVLWMFPNKRAFMLKCSPFIVFYGTVLLLVGYVYSIKLNEGELPTELCGVSMDEIGFPSPDVISSWHLIVKCAFMAMFWITMRQYMAEQRRNKQTSTLRDMVAPLHLSVTAATAIHHDTPEIKSKFMKDVGRVVKKLLTKFWIIVVAIMLFTSGITGERMTVFRIMYMTLFLIFVISFQISWAGWRKMMFSFWITVIAYSVVMLILVYTYQFPNFPVYWSYLHIDDDLQKDIGLEAYETKDLFVRLLTPTFFVIITVIQIHYFHADFLEITNIDRINVGTVSQRGSLGRSSIIPQMATLDALLAEGEEHSPRYTLRQLKQMSKLERAEFYRRTLEELKNFYSNIWLFFEIHIQKIIFTSMMILCVNDVCAINFIFVIVIVVTINFKKSIQIIAINSMAVAIAILLVIKMLYQIQYIEHSSADVNCTSDASNNSSKINYVTYNIAEWIGMKKAATGMLPDLLKGYIGIVTVTTVRAIIIIRQCFHRSSKGEPLETPQVMFPKITRADADKGIAECLKFFFNYGFYKFGLECCLITIVALIGTRMDFYSVIYGIWLLIFFAQSRRVTAIIWPFFHIFIIIIIPIQYAFAVAPPPWFCIDYPWDDSEILKRLQAWMYLPDPGFPPNARNLMCDFLLLFMVTRQSLVFRIEARNIANGTEFVAGHNSSIFHESDKPNFVNPVKDYVTYIHSWLDIVKRGTMMSLLWITLSIMFLAGTKRTNLFSLGYLIGAFIFLWQGGDFYLRPSKVIIKWWNLLIGYNVIVIVMKAFLQGIGCVLIEQLEQSACWLIQLLGISCLQDAPKSIIPVDPLSCYVSREDVGMVWDGLCFAFLLIQKRLFKSYYFFHIVNETKAMSVLASRGAELMENIHRKRIEFQESIERAVLQKIKLKMDKIKADQQRIQGPSYRELTAHHVDSVYPRDRPLYRQRAPKTNREAVRSGDYYMFDDFDDDDDMMDLIPDFDAEFDADDQRRQPRHSRTRRMTVSEDGTSAPATKESEEKIQEKKDDERRTPGPSDADDIDDAADTSVDEKPKKKHVHFMTYCKFLLELINSFMITATKYLNKFSRDYRYIRKILAKEKHLLKNNPDFYTGARLGISQMWKPISIMKESSTVSKTQSSVKTDEDQEPELSEIDQPPIIQLLASLWFGVLAHSTFVCYFMIFLHQIKNASVLSTPLPLMVFFWGSLTIPRPSKTFWVTIIAYTEAIVIVKCIYQLELVGGNPIITSTKPLDTSRIIGVERKLDYALWDLLLLLVIFFHRFMLKSMGQWTTAYTVRKINPTQPVIGSPSENNSQDELSRFRWQNEQQNKRSSLSLHEPEEEASTSRDPKLDTSGNDEEESTEEDRDNEDEENDENQIKTNVMDVNVCTEPLPSAFKLAVTKYLEPTKIFFAYILNQDGKEKTNVYAYMFLCDFFNFLLVIFGFPSFGPQQSDDGVANYLEENRVPMTFLMMLLLQFALIVIDRALYLKKSISGKLFFHYCLVFGVHVWMFFILPGVTERQFINNVLPQIWYMIKCFYLLLAAYQLRLGYPTRILGNFLCKNYSMINYGLFKIFMMVPFLFELRAVMDWIWTDTSMTIMDWFKMEDIFANIYQIKCMRGVESDYPQPRGVKKQQMSKYMVGGGLLFLIIGLIWFPLLFFALGRSAGISNIPYEVSLKIRIGSHEPIYIMSARDDSITQYTKGEFSTMKSHYADRAAVTFLENYGYADVATVELSGSSQKLWAITPPDKEKLRQDLLSNETMVIMIEWSVSRKTDVKELSDTSNDQRAIELKPYIHNEFNPIRKSLADILASNAENSNASVVLNNAFPKFIKVTSRKITVSRPLMYSLKVPETDYHDNDTADANRAFLYRNITLKLVSDGTQHWWVINENCDDDIYKYILQPLPKSDCQYMIMFLFNDKILPAGWSFISGFGILGLYTTAVILVSQIMRRSFSEMAPKIMFDDMPYVDRVLRLCLDVYLVRESKELCLEEDLFAKLIFLYRSPETLIRWTRPPEPTDLENDDEDDNDDDDDDDVNVAGMTG
ncbi:hypothetical protein PV327_006669 [Microctonus hyperodae]|uniref:Piezo-type mechanosensitive ion channel component n=1 Tax=Microctonus hyperodae TaxID=165561 RepID=A0AA39F4V9_MICHY|nr:hypothetical protein PV327_006669 [Microctonus hyperodae]